MGLADFDGRRSTGKAGKAGLERRDFGERPVPAFVDGGHAELVRGARLEIDLPQCTTLHIILNVDEFIFGNVSRTCNLN